MSTPAKRSRRRSRENGRRRHRQRPRTDRQAARSRTEDDRCDNGPEFISQSLRDWCRFNHAGTGYIEPGAPWQNPFVESFNGHLRRELLDLESFNTLFEAQLLLDDWRLEYNHYRPHQSLNYMTPAEYARTRKPKGQPELS